MLQRIASGALKSNDVLVDVALRKNALTEEAVVGEIAAEIVVVPGGFSFHPGLGRNAEPRPIRFPRGTGTWPRLCRIDFIFRDETMGIESLWRVAVQEVESSAFLRP